MATLRDINIMKHGKYKLILLIVFYFSQLAIIVNAYFVAIPFANNVFPVLIVTCLVLLVFHYEKTQ